MGCGLKFVALGAATFLVAYFLFVLEAIDSTALGSRFLRRREANLAARTAPPAIAAAEPIATAVEPFLQVELLGM